MNMRWGESFSKVISLQSWHLSTSNPLFSQLRWNQAGGLHLSLFNCALGQMIELSGFYLPQLITHEYTLFQIFCTRVCLCMCCLCSTTSSAFNRCTASQVLRHVISAVCCLLWGTEIESGSAATHSGNLKYRKHSLLSLLRHKLHSIFMPLNALFSKTNLFVFSLRLFRHDFHLPIHIDCDLALAPMHRIFFQSIPPESFIHFRYDWAWAS